MISHSQYGIKDVNECGIVAFTGNNRHIKAQVKLWRYFMMVVQMGHHEVAAAQRCFRALMSSSQLQSFMPLQTVKSTQFEQSTVLILRSYVYSMSEISDFF